MEGRRIGSTSLRRHSIVQTGDADELMECRWRGAHTMIGDRAADARSAALDAYLARRAAQGDSVETRSGVQAVTVRRHRLYFLLRWLAPGYAEERVVVSVDQHGEVDSLAAEPVRW